MLNKLVSYAHILILGWTGFAIYSNYMEHTERYQEISSRIPIIENQITKKENEKKLLTDYYKDIEAAKEKIETVAREVEKLQQQLPDNILDTNNLELFSSIAQGLNIKNIFLTPKEEVVNDFYISKEYEMKATGTFLQFVIFLEKVGLHERLFNIENMRIEHTKEKQKGRFQLVNAEITLTAYKYNPQYKEDRGIQEIEEKFKQKTVTPMNGGQP